jgi:hypothetical protein
MLYIRPAIVDFISCSYDNRQKMTEDELDTINHQLINILFRLGKVAKDNKDVLPIVAEIDALVKRAGGAAERGVDGSNEGRAVFRRQASGNGDELGDWGAGGAHLLQQQGGAWGSADSDEVERLRRELEEVRSEKVEMEYVMRERLEIIVTEEVCFPRSRAMLRVFPSTHTSTRAG